MPEKRMKEKNKTIYNINLYVSVTSHLYLLGFLAVSVIQLNIVTAQYPLYSFFRANIGNVDESFEHLFRAPTFIQSFLFLLTYLFNEEKDLKFWRALFDQTLAQCFWPE